MNTYFTTNAAGRKTLTDDAPENVRKAVQAGFDVWGASPCVEGLWEICEQAVKAHEERCGDIVDHVAHEVAEVFCSKYDEVAILDFMRDNLSIMLDAESHAKAEGTSHWSPNSISEQIIHTMYHLAYVTTSAVLDTLGEESE